MFSWWPELVDDWKDAYRYVQYVHVMGQCSHGGTEHVDDWKDAYRYVQYVHMMGQCSHGGPEHVDDWKDAYRYVQFTLDQQCHHCQPPHGVEEHQYEKGCKNTTVQNRT